MLLHNHALLRGKTSDSAHDAPGELQKHLNLHPISPHTQSPELGFVALFEHELFLDSTR